MERSISVPCGINRNAKSAIRLMSKSNHSSRKTNNKSLSICSHWLANVFEDIAKNKMMLLGWNAEVCYVKIQSICVESNRMEGVKTPYLSEKIKVKSGGRRK